MVNTETVEKIINEIKTGIISHKFTKRSAEVLIICFGKEKGELEGKKIELQTSLEQTKKLIRDLVKERAALFVSSETTSEVGKEETKFNLASIVSCPEQ